MMDTSELLQLSSEELMRFGESLALKAPQCAIALLQGAVMGLALERFPDRESLQQQARCAPMVVYDNLMSGLRALQAEHTRRTASVVLGEKSVDAIPQHGDPSSRSTGQMIG